MEETIVNRVANSGLMEIDLEDYYTHGPRKYIDLKEQLFHGLILKEKDFREWLNTHTWEQYKDAYTAVHCSADAIIPVWAYMLVASKLAPIAKKVVFGDLVQLETQLYYEKLSEIDFSPYHQQRVVVKGCGNLPVPPAAYLMLTAALQPLVKSIMYGEACSTVPIYKKAKG